MPTKLSVRSAQVELGREHGTEARYRRWLRNCLCIRCRGSVLEGVCLSCGYEKGEPVPDWVRTENVRKGPYRKGKPL